jgi:deoxyribodipyrimidine photolyase-related protein
MEVTLIYPHQLFQPNIHPALHPNRVVYLVEESFILTHNPIHRAKLVLHRLSMVAYQKTLEGAGYEVRYLDIREYPTTDSVFGKLRHDGVAVVHIVDTTDDYLEQAIANAGKTYGFSRVSYDPPLFFLTKEDACTRYIKSRRHMGRFYKQLRIDTGILMNGDEPLGGQFSFDVDNRQKIPKGTPLPTDIILKPVPADVLTWLSGVSGEQYGDTTLWLPTTHQETEKFLAEFLRLRLADFGPYEDAIDTTHTRLWHSTLSPLINIGLLTPRQVIDTTLSYAAAHDISLQSREGFIRQIIGWREFIRASYEVDGRTMRTKNFFQHTRPLPPGSWDASTGVLPLDHTIQTALRCGYTHHIERLMVAGNFFLLTQTDPEQVYRWFMGLYIDAYDWVMVPNVYGMSQFTDGGLFATKPYISGSAYLRKMSNYPKGDWEGLWTALYWNFIQNHKEFFTTNHRLSMMPKLLEKMSPEKRQTYAKTAHEYLQNTNEENAR